MLNDSGDNGFLPNVLHALYFSGAGWCLHWNGVCLCVTTTPEVTSGKTALPVVLASSRPSWQKVTGLLL